MVVIKKKLIKLEEFLEKNPKIKKKFNKEFKKYENRPKPNKKLKIGLKYIKKNFNLNLFLKQIEKYNYKYMDEGDMLDRVIQYGFKQDEVYKIRDHFDNKEYDKLRKLADDYKLLVKITDNFKAIDYMAEKVETETLSKWIEATLLYSQINFTYYLFIDEINFTEQNRGNCLYFKSKNKKLIINKMIKFFDKLKKKYNQGGVMKILKCKINTKKTKVKPIITNLPPSLIKDLKKFSHMGETYRSEFDDYKKVKKFTFKFALDEKNKTITSLDQYPSYWHGILKKEKLEVK